MNTVNTPLYEVFFVEAEGHLIDIRDVVYVGPVSEGSFFEDGEFSFNVVFKTDATVHVCGTGEEILNKVRATMCEKIKSLYMPFEQPEVKETDTVTKIKPKKNKDNNDDK